MLLEFDDPVGRQVVGPAAAVDIAPHLEHRCNLAERCHDRIAGVRGIAQRRQRLRAQQTVSIGNHADLPHPGALTHRPAFLPPARAAPAPKARFM